MATTTPNFGWPVPTSTDLVKDGATAMEALGDAIDTSMVDLKGGTTGQVLAKASATDMDFSWVAQDDSNAIQNSIVDAKGDLIAASAADTPARLAVGSNGETLVADSSTSTGLRYQGNFAAGKNKIINGDFNIWQRGTSFSPPGAGSYTSDRWRTSYGTAVPTTYVLSRETFTPGSEPVSGYNSPYYLRSVLTTLGTCTEIVVQQRIEDVTTFANSTITVSFYAKSDTTRTQSVAGNQNFGSGGSAGVGITAQTITTTSSWQRFSLQFAIPSISGKTIGTGSYVQINIIQNLTNGNTLDIWGVQVEAGSVATAFQTATGTIQGETSACQRYYQRFTGPGSNPGAAGYGYSQNANNVVLSIPPVTTMRVTPTTIDYTGLLMQDNLNNTVGTFSSVTMETSVAGPSCFSVNFTKSGAYTAGRTFRLIGASANDYIGFSAEL